MLIKINDASFFNTRAVIAGFVVLEYKTMIEMQKAAIDPVTVSCSQFYNICD